jgi:uncharacterized membrane protein
LSSWEWTRRRYLIIQGRLFLLLVVVVVVVVVVLLLLLLLLFLCLIPLTDTVSEGAFSAGC